MKDYKILAVVGSRTFCDWKRGFKFLNQIFRMYIELGEIVSGDADGADAIGKKYADVNNIEYTGIPAKWQDMSEPCIRKVDRRGREYNALAGINRNTDIAKYCDILVAFWDGKSKGTKDVIEKAKEFKKKVIIIHI